MKTNFLNLKNMKIKITSLILLGSIGFTFGQNVKTKQNIGGVIPSKVWHNENASRGAIIFQEDFSFGIPGTWTNNTVSGPVNWKHTTVGHTGDYPTAAIQSTTSNNGWILVDSDADNFSGGGAEEAELTTPIIDCSGFSPVKVEFQQMFRRWTAEQTIVRVTTDGVNFTDFEINQNVTQTGTDNPDFVNIDITSAISGDPSNVQIQFKWIGAWDYGWQIDDFAVKEVDANDILVKKAAMSEDVTYYKVPSTQVQDLFFSAFAENIGFNAQTNVELNVDVNFGMTSVFNNSSAAISLLGVGVSDSLFLTNTFLPSSTGNYEISFTVDQTEVDDDTDNNTRVLNYEVTDSVYAIDNNIYGGQWWNLESGPGQAAAFEIGAVYEVVSDANLTSVNVFIGDQSTVGTLFEVGLYVYNPGSETYDALYTQEAFVEAADVGDWAWVSLDQMQYLTAGNDYLIAVKHYGGADYLYIGYGSNSSARGATLSNDGQGSAWSNQPRTPMIRLNLAPFDLSVANETSGFSIYPNPSTGILQINSELVNDFEVIVTDLQGKNLMRFNNAKVIDLSVLAKGSYFVSIISGNDIKTEKVIIK